METQNNLKDEIIKNAVKNLKTYGYPLVDKTNIFTDEIYSAFFKSILKDNLGKGFDLEINNLLKDIEATKCKPST